MAREYGHFTDRSSAAFGYPAAVEATVAEIS
jgi:hypothetical protein